MPNHWRTLQVIVLFFAHFAHSQPPRPVNDAICPVGDIPWTVVAQDVVILSPVYINTFVEENTVLIINGGLTINIDNAPTSLDFTTFSTTTTTTVITTISATPS